MSKNILFLNWKSFGNNDIFEAFQKLGYEVVNLPYDDSGEKTTTEETKMLEDKMREVTPQFVFSFNYFPAAAIACKNQGVPYLSWIYDCPYVRLYHYTTIYPTNHIFVFDKSLFMEFHQSGVPTIHYLPLAANPERILAMQDWDFFEKSQWNPQKEVAFIGSMYTERHQFFDRMKELPPYVQGYLDGVMNTQMKVYGDNFVQRVLTKDIIAQMQKSLPIHVDPETVATEEYLFAQYVINRRIAAIERQDLLGAVAGQYGLDLYTPEKKFVMQGTVNHGPVDYYDVAPYVFRKAQINLNITLRSIKTGIPLRGFDILGAGGFLLTNYQEDFYDCFVPDEDFVFYESKEDMLDKIAYYLNHEEERKQIAENGLHRVIENHTYQHRVEEMLTYL